jgi:hypothetical protein
MEQTNSKSTDTLPPPYHEESLSTPSSASSFPPPGCGWTSEQIARRTLFSHGLSLLFAIPALALFAVDLHAYSSQTHPTAYSITHPTRFFHSNPITIIDGIALASFSITILYSAAYLASLGQTRQLLTPATIYQHTIFFCITDFVLWAAVLGISDTSLSMRISNSTCQKYLYLDEGACDSYRLNIMQAAGATGIVTR